MSDQPSMCTTYKQISFITCSEHDGRVAVVGAADYGSDDERSVTECVFSAIVQEGNRGALLFLRNVEAFKPDLSKTNIRARQCDCSDPDEPSRVHASRWIRTRSCALIDPVPGPETCLFLEAVKEVLLHAGDGNSVL